jgi:hypothetical protein
MEDLEALEKGQSTSTAPKPQGMTLDKAIELGEYNPEFLASFPEWHTFSRHIQFEYIRKALDTRNRHLMTQWAEITNVLDFRLKPHLTEALRNIERQLEHLRSDKERLYVEYSK